MRAINLKAVLTRITGAADYYRFACDFNLLASIKGKVVAMYSKNTLYDIFGIWTLNGNFAILFALVFHCHIKVLCLLHNPCHILVYV